MRRLLVLLAFALFWSMTVVAQQPDAPEEDDNGFVVGLINNLLSGPGRDVHISGISGILTSQATIDRITVADADGVWLTIENVGIDWSRAALFLRRVSITSLTIARIDYVRPPLPPEPTGPTLADVEAQPFRLPELPVEVRVDTLRVDEIVFGEPVLGQAAALSVEGRASLVAGEIDTELAIRRLDGPGGELDLTVAFSNQTRLLDLDVRLSEPAGGIVATLLDIEGRPAIDLALQGSGPLDDVDLAFSLDADATRLAEGTVELRQTGEGLAFLADFGGELAPLVPPDYRPFFAGRSTVRVDGVNIAAGGLRLDELAIAGAALDLRGRLELGPDGFLQSLNLTGDIGDPRGPALTLPVPGGATRLTSGTLHVTYGDASRWTGLLWLDRLGVGDIEIEDLSLTMGGLAQNLEDPARRNVTLNLEGLATGIWAEDPEVRAALGDRIDFFADAAIPPGDAPVAIRQLQVSGNGIAIFTAGSLDGLLYSGRHAVRLADIAPFSQLAGRPLAGAVDVRADGSVWLASGGFDLVLDGTAEDLAFGEPRADALLAGTTELSGRVTRDESGLATDGFRIANPQVEFTSTGVVSSDRTAIGFEAALADLALLAPEVSGRLTASGRAEGDATAVAVTLEAAVPEGSLAGRPLVGARIGFAGEVGGGEVAGRLTGTGQVENAPIGLAADLALSENRRALSDLLLTVGPNRIAGELAQPAGEPIEGRLAIDAPDLAPLAALALVEAAGAARADVTLGPADVGQRIALTASLTGVEAAGARVGALDLSADVSDAFGVPLADATLTGSDLVVAGVALDTLAATATTTGPDSMDFTAETRLAVGTEATLAGTLERLEPGFALALDRLTLAQEGVSARLAAPTRLTLQDAVIDLAPLALEIGGGRLEAEGTIAETLDLDLTIAGLPLAIANTIRPDLGLAGTLDGTARVGGTRAAPDVAFRLTGTGLASAQTVAAGLPVFAVEATGTTDGTRLNVDAAISGNGISATATGGLPLAAGPLELTIDLAALPLALVDRLAGNRGLEGSVTGRAVVTGTLAAPDAAFSLQGTGLSARILRENAVPPLAMTAEGRFAAGTVALSSASVTGPGGISASLSGTIPLQGPGLDLRAAGSLPLALANPALAERTAQVAGEVSFELVATGSLAAPQLAGPVRVVGGTFVDPQLNLRFDGIALDAQLQGDAIQIAAFSARGAQGGTMTGAGRLGIGPGRPADLQIGFQSLRLSDGALYSTTITGALTVTGPIVGAGGLVAGRLDLGPTEISIAEGFGGNAAVTLAEVSHRNATRPIARTLARARATEPRPPQPRGNGLGLNILIAAPNQIFVRGRGLDAEVGGELRLEGTTGDIQPVGEFTLRRGRIALLGQRIQIDEGSVRLVGNLDPEISFVAETRAGEATAFVTVSGRASEPVITFSSIPPRPEDEVLALVLFNRSVDQLSPFQIAQLAAAAAELAGAGGNGLLSQIRAATGFDDLDIITEEDGATAVRAGRYLADNLYLDVQTSSEGEARATVNLDITERFTARGSVGTDGNSTIGIYFQRDY